MCKLTFPFGKYPGTTLERVVADDLDYAITLLGTSWFAKEWPALARELAHLIRKRITHFPMRAA